MVTNGYWHARTEWFRNYPWLSWARMPGDVVFMAGSAPLVWLTFKVALRTRKTPTPVDQTGTTLEASLYTETVPAGATLRGLRRGARTDCDPGVSSMLPNLTAWGFEVDLGLVLLLAYLLVLWAGGWGLEYLARAHFHRAQRYAHNGFAFDVELDRYECPQGELLTLTPSTTVISWPFTRRRPRRAMRAYSSRSARRTTRAGTSTARWRSSMRWTWADFTVGSL